ncbi:MAG: outer membrane protein assembly factor BamA [Terriglobales bacterium]
MPKAAFLLAFFLFLLAPFLYAQENIVQEIVIHGNRRIPADTIRARIFTKPGDVYDEASLQRDFNSLWNTGYFDDLRMEREESPKGYRIHVYVKEKPTIRSIEYKGLSSVSQSDVLDRFKNNKVGLSVENQYDPTKVKKAEVALKELLSEHGRQFASVRTEIRPIPPAAVAVTFVIKEGPKVKVGKIKFEGNKRLSSRELRAAMKNLRPIGVPHSIFLENLWAKTYDASKLSEDSERIRDEYQQKGYFKVLVQDPQTKIRDTGGIPIPIIHHTGGKAVDITIPIEEGDKFRLKQITFKNNKAVPNSAGLRKLFPMQDGDVFNTSLVRKGLENLRKAYGELGYINFTAVPDTQIDDEKKLISLAIDVDEGKPFLIRRIEFSGNTTTRDKVIRRELAVEEGGVYNSRLWELSLLRLNQLQYFEPLKPETDSETKQDAVNNTVDLTLKVKEKGKNSIGLTGGFSGLAGGFIGINYQTNNFLGFGETLTLEANVGNRERNFTFGFTEPYFRDRPITLGFTVFTRYFNYNEAQQTAQALGTNQLNVSQSFLNGLQNYSQNTTGFTVSSSYPLHRSFKRVSLTYSFDVSSIKVYSGASSAYFQALAFRGFAGPNALDGVITSKVLPSISWSTIDNPQRPHTGSSTFIGGEIAGLGGTVRSIRPIFEYKQFVPVNKGRNALGYRLQASYLTGFGGVVAPPFERFYMGGDNDIRGFDVRSLSPYGFLLSNNAIPLLNPDGSTIPRDPSNPRQGIVTVPLPLRTLVATGGDTNVVANVEYRIPLFGPVTLAPFFDAGINGVLRTSQLRISDQALESLNATAFGCTAFINLECTGSQHFTFDKEIRPVPGTNWQPRASTGLELQVILPIVNAPFRIYYAYNPLRLDKIISTPNQCFNTVTGISSCVDRSQFPAGGAGDFTFLTTQAASQQSYLLREPKSSFRFTISTTF